MSRPVLHSDYNLLYMSLKAHFVFYRLNLYIQCNVYCVISRFVHVQCVTVRDRMIRQKESQALFKEGRL